jgi:hypothetical protein
VVMAPRLTINLSGLFIINLTEVLLEISLHYFFCEVAQVAHVET